MATINGVSVWVGKGVARTIFETMGDDDVGRGLSAPNLPDKTVQVTGTFGSAVVTIQGSNDNAIWKTLADPNGNAITFAAAGIETLLENPQYIRPTTSGGTNTDLDVVFLSSSTGR